MRRVEESILTLSAGIGGKNERTVSPVDSFSPPALGSTVDASDIDNGGELINLTSRKDQLPVSGRRDVVSEGRSLGPWDTVGSATAETVGIVLLAWYVSLGVAMPVPIMELLLTSD